MSHDSTHDTRPTIGSLFAGIGGFDLGFENAGFRTAWQVEIDDSVRAVLADRFPSARRYRDVREVGSETLERVDVLTAGFPCQDISNAGNSRKAGRLGLKGPRSGLFHEVCRVVGKIRPRWLVLEKVAALTFSNKGQDMSTVLGELRELGYVGYWRVLDAQYFGSSARRRRVFLVAGYRERPPIELLSDAAPVEAIPSALPALEFPRPENAWPGYTLQALNTPARISLGGQTLVAEQDGFSKMDDRLRMSECDDLCSGLDAANLAEAKGAGNAVCPEVAKWIAKKLIKTF